MTLYRGQYLDSHIYQTDRSTAVQFSMNEFEGAGFDCVCAKRDIASKPCNFCENVSHVCGVNLRPSVRIIINYIVELHPQSPRHFAQKHSAPVFKRYGAPTSVT
jgi:hypothetical protein